MKLSGASEMKNLEEITFSRYLIPSVLLMENAAHGFFDALKEEVGNLEGKNIAVFCGKGNNGGDGYAIARYLKNAGSSVCIYSLCPEENITGNSLTNYKAAKKMDIPIKTLPDTLPQYDIIIDAIFGIGFHGTAEGVEKKAIELINKNNAFVASVDIPSGISADNGKVSGVCIQADFVVTFGLAKTGLYLYPAKSYSKKVVVKDISIPKDVLDNFKEGAYLLDSDILKHLPVRCDNSHKGNFGRVMCVCGSKGFTGACEMAATAAQKSGAGLVTAAVPKDIFDIMASKFTEIMTLCLSENAHDASDTVLNAQKDAILLGCGIGRSDFAKKLSLEIISKTDAKLVIDADGINALAENINILKMRSCPTILTPHIKEFARLVKMSAEDVLTDRIELSQGFAKEYNCVLVLKNADTIIALPDGRFYICKDSNSGLAKGGSGDVLAGLCASFLAQGVSAEMAACISVYLHSRAGIYAKEALGEYFMSATDIIKYLPKAFGEKQA